MASGPPPVSTPTAEDPKRDLVWRLAEVATAPVFGDDYFGLLVNRLSRLLRVKCVLLGEVFVEGTGPSRLRTRAVVVDGEPAPNFEYGLSHSPCGEVIGKTLCWHADGVTQLFPDDPRLRQLGARAYVGVPLFSSRQEPLGLLALAHDGPLPEDEELKAVLKICAGRAGGELERARIEMRLRRSEERLRASIENTPHVAVHWHDADGRVCFWNQASEELFGWKAQEVLGRSLRGLVYSDETSRRFDVLLAAVKAGEGPQGPVEFEVRRRDGTLGFCEATVFSIPGEQGGAWFVCTLVDVTVRKQAEQELRSSEAKYRHILASSPVPMLVTDLGQRVISVNAKFTEVFGYNQDELAEIDAWWLKAYPDPVYRSKVRADWVGQLDRALLDGSAVGPMEVDAACKDGSVRRVQCSAAVNADRILIVFTDLTDRLRLENELRQAQKLEVVGHLAGGVAHDFNNIIQAVLGFIGLAQDGLLTAEDRDAYLKEALGAAKRASQLTRQLLAFGRRQAMHFEVVDLGELVGNLLKLLRRLIGENIDVQLRTDAAMGRVRCDPTQMEQVLINLCVNSRDAMPGGGKITITVEKKVITPSYKHAHPWSRVGRFAMITVTDTGCGMDKATQERVFEPFFTTKPKEKGSGLGLAVVYGIVRQHDGFIRLYSEPGLGTTIRIYVPTVEAPGQSPEAPVRRRLISGGHETVLVAEDDETIRSLVRKILERAGYQVILATNGEEAVSLYEAHRQKIDLLVFDAVMPKLSGLEAYERIRRLDERAVPTIFASGYNDAFSPDHASLPEGAVLMQKPYDPDELLQKIRELLLVSDPGTPVQGAGE